MCNIHIVNIVISIKKEGVTKRKKRAWWKQKSERIAQRKFGGFRVTTQHVCFGTRLCRNNKKAATYVTAFLHYPYLISIFI